MSTSDTGHPRCGTHGTPDRSRDRRRSDPVQPASENGGDLIHVVAEMGRVVARDADDLDGSRRRGPAARVVLVPGIRALNEAEVPAPRLERNGCDASGEPSPAAEGFPHPGPPGLPERREGGSAFPPPIGRPLRGGKAPEGADVAGGPAEQVVAPWRD